MNITRALKVLNSKYLLFSYLILSFFITACNQPTPQKYIKLIDSSLVYHETSPVLPSQNAKLNAIRNLLGKQDIPRLSSFFKIKSFYFANSNIDSLNLYADSALLLFENKSLIAIHEKHYFDALLLKGDALYLAKKYSRAVLYYLEARSFREKNLDVCDNKDLALRIGNVYYSQDKFLQSASYYKESYQLEVNCSTEKDALKQFYDQQALLNNIGYSYEKAKLLDSALYYYNKDLTYINDLKKEKKIALYALNDAAAIVLDNLGSIYLKKGNFDKAEQLLHASIAIEYSGGDDAQTPPMIKLAQLYTLKSNFLKANECFNKAYALLEKNPNPELLARWTKSKSEFYHQQQQFQLAFNLQQQYMKLKDALIKDRSSLSTIDIEKDFASLEQKYNLQDLKKKDAFKTIYLISATFLLLMVITIVLLLQRNIIQAKRNSQIIQLNNQELQESLLRLEETNQNYSRVMKVMAHDLRNPLGGISGLSSLLLAEQENKENRESLEVIKSAADHALDLINEILNAALASKTEEDLVKTDLNLKTLLLECVSLFKIKANEKKQELILHGEEDIHILADKEKLWRVFNNIIVNAIKFSHQDTMIEISLVNHDNQVTISIADHGIGIPLAFKTKLFDLFTETKRLGTAGEKSFGLGLSISKKIIEGHHGKIWFDDNLNGGTIFFIQLPK